MRVLVVGGQGQLGQKLLQVINRETDWELVSVIRDAIVDQEGYANFDITSRNEWKRMVMNERWRPNVIINAAAFTDVDGCETERERAWKSNVQLVEILLSIARNVEAQLVQVSTDYVFDGTEGPYSETARPNPINYYGKTKLAAENICTRSGVDSAIVRTMWLFGHSENGRRNFVDWVVEQLENKDTVPVVVDEIGNPTLTDDLAYGIIQIIEKKFQGVLNVAGEDLISRLEFAREIAEQLNADPKRIVPLPSGQLVRAAKRPLRSGLVTLKARSSLDIRPRSVKDAVNMYLTQRKRLEEARL